MPGININNSKHSLYNLFKNTKSITTYYIAAIVYFSICDIFTYILVFCSP